jgi:hypothetical protein
MIAAVTFGQSNEQVPVKRGAKVIKMIKHDVSPRLRDIPVHQMPAGVKHVVPNKPLPPRTPDPRRPVTGELDPAMQLSAGTGLNIPSATKNWEGVGEGFVGPQGTHHVNVAPPDTNGDVGPNHYVQIVNLSFAVFNKFSGTVLYGPTPINTLWMNFGGQCETSNSGDPTVIYDQFNDRWIISQFAVSSQPYLQCIAVSTTGDPLGSYNRFSYSYGNGFNDYPKMGIWNGDYFITYNIFTNGSSFAGGEVCGYNGPSLRAGQANSMQCFTEGGGGLLAADQDGSTTAPAGAPEYVMSFGSNSLNVWKMKIDWNNSNNSSFAGPSVLSVNPFSPAPNASQPGTSQTLDALSDRLMNRLSYRNRSGVESFLLNHSVTASGVGAFRWYELRTLNSATTTPSVFQQGTYSPDTNNRWMGSIAMDAVGNIGAGYSVSSSANNVKPSVRYSGRLASDPAGTFGQGEATIINGTGVQTSGLSRWGDYSSINIDPTDDCTFWYTDEYMAVDGTFNWHTRIGAFKFNNCGSGSSDVTAPTTSITSPTNGQTVSGTIPVSANADDNVGVTLVEFYADNIYIGSDNSSPYQINWNTTNGSNGGHSLISRAYDAAGNVGASSAVNVTVNNPGVASYDATLKAPRCSVVDTFCDSGTLLLGRNLLGPELNQPNTINNSCADGSSGSFHSDESNDRIRVATNDSSPFASGKTVTVTATVWAWVTPSADALDLYYAADATNPSWTLIGTFVPPAAGQQTISASYVLPNGNLQAVRARFRYQGTPSPCATGAYDDHDDLIFAVGSGCSLPGTPLLTSPANGATGTSITPVLDWSDVNGATSYDVQVATDTAFTNVVRSANVVSSTWAVSPALNNNTTYFWRAKANNGCGGGSFPSGFSFTTVAAASGNFSIACSPTSLSVAWGTTKTSTCTITSTNNFNSAVSLSCTGLAAKTSCSFTPNPATPPANGSINSTLTVSVQKSAAVGTRTIQVVATSGALSHSTNLQLTVTKK